MKTFYYSPLVNKTIELRRIFSTNFIKYSTRDYNRICICYEQNMLKCSPKIYPDRYLWHLSYPYNREKILSDGIIPNYEEHHTLFVNAQIEDPFKLWPIVYDDSHMIFNWDDYENKEDAFFACTELKFSDYDFWRIDSNIAGYEGYHIDINDPAFMIDNKEEKGFFGARPDDYICREKPIKASALKLFRYKRGTIRKYYNYLRNNEPLDFKLYDGVASVCGIDKSQPYFLEEI